MKQQIRQTCEDLEMKLGCEAWIVGGYNRDTVLELPPKDVDIEIYNTTPEDLTNSFSDIQVVGKSFGVYLLKRDGIEYNISFPRKEKLIDNRTWSIEVDGMINKHDACQRRDFTINAIMFRPTKIITFDPFNGLYDLQRREIRIVNPHTFAEDPLRVMRAFSLSSRCGLTLDPISRDIMRNLIGDYDSIPVERIWIEWEKWSFSTFPEYGIKVLIDTGWIKNFPELNIMLDTPQDSIYHPEGDVMTHTIEVIQRLSGQGYLTFAALLHDAGKAVTSIHGNNRVSSPNHAISSARMAYRFFESLKAPHDIRNKVVELCQFHMFDHTNKIETAKVVNKLAHITEVDLIQLKRADKNDQTINIEKPVKRLVTGKDIIHLIPEGPEMGRILNLAFNAQIEGAFNTTYDGIEWVKQQL